jgi:hypothetical protein
VQSIHQAVMNLTLGNCAVILGKLAQIDERLFAEAISLFCYKGIATGAGLIDLIAGTSVLK